MSPSVPSARCPRRRLVAQGVGGVHGHGAQPLLGGQQLLEHIGGRLRARANPPVHPGGNLVDRTADVVDHLEVRKGPRRIGGRCDVQPSVHEVVPAGEPAEPVIGIVAAEPGQDAFVQDPIGSAIEVDHGGNVHRDQASQLLVRHLESVLEPVMERIRPGGPERRLVGVEEQLQRRGAHGVDRYLPAGLVGPGDGFCEVRWLPVHRVATAIVEMDLQTLDAKAVVDGAGLARRVPVPEELAVEVEGEVRVDAKRQGVVGGQGLELVQALLVDPLLADRGPAAGQCGVHGRLG